MALWLSPAGGAIIALVGVALTALVSAYLGGRNRRWQLVDARRDTLAAKGEIVYVLIEKWRNSQTSWFLQCRLVMNGDIDYNKFLDIFLESNTGVDLQVERIEFLLTVFFNATFLEWQKCIQFAHIASRIENAFKLNYKVGIHSGQEQLPELQQAMLELNSQINVTLDHLTKSVRAKVAI